jgi:hypothetical protein
LLNPLFMVLPACFIERFLLLMLGGKSLHWLNQCLSFKSSIRV